MKTIRTLAKSTSAACQYWELSEEDRLWLTRELILFLANTTEQAQHRRALRDEWFRAQAAFPRGRSGANSMASMTAGIVTQLIRNHDLTTAHIEALPAILDVAGHAVRFTQTVDLFDLA